MEEKFKSIPFNPIMVWAYLDHPTAHNKSTLYTGIKPQTLKSLHLTLLNPFIFTFSSLQNHCKLPQAACELVQSRFNKQIRHPPGWEVIPKVCSESQAGLSLLCGLVPKVSQSWGVSQSRGKGGSVPLPGYWWLILQFHSQCWCCWSCCSESWDQIQERCCMQSLKNTSQTQLLTLETISVMVFTQITTPQVLFWMKAALLLLLLPPKSSQGS